MRVCLLRKIANGGKKTTGAEGRDCLRRPATTAMRVAIVDHQLALIERQLPKAVIEAVDPVLTHHRCGGVCAQENRRCGNDPSHQGAARENGGKRQMNRAMTKLQPRKELVTSGGNPQTDENPKTRIHSLRQPFAGVFLSFRTNRASPFSPWTPFSERRLKSCQRLSASVFCVLGYDRFDTCLRFLEENV
jgi:hypothetical protein